MRTRLLVVVIAFLLASCQGTNSNNKSTQVSNVPTEQEASDYDGTPFWEKLDEEGVLIEEEILEEWGDIKEENYIEDKEEGLMEVYKHYNFTFADDELFMTDSLIRNTAKGFKFVKNNWDNTLFVEFNPEERPIEILELDSSRLFILTYYNDDYYGYVVNSSGQILTYKELSSDSRDYFKSFTVYDGKVYYKSRNKRVIEYDCDNNITTDVGELSEYVHIFGEESENEYLSPDSSKTMMVNDYNIVLVDNVSGTKDTLITSSADSYGSDWLFEEACWNNSGDKFYFDNSGSNACIWEIDLNKMNIDKIVPEHFAGRPTYIDNSVYYCLGRTVRKTTFESFGNKLPDYVVKSDTISYRELKDNGYNISPIKYFPSSNLLPNTDKAYYAVNSSKGGYHIKLLFRLSYAKCVVTSSFALEHNSYRAEFPEPYYREGKIIVSCYGEDGDVYVDYFELKGSEIKIDASARYSDGEY